MIILLSFGEQKCGAEYSRIYGILFEILCPSFVTVVAVY